MLLFQCKWSWLALVTVVAVSTAIPTSVVEDIKTNELRENKVKRSEDTTKAQEEKQRKTEPFYDNPTAIKRGSTLRADDIERGVPLWGNEDNDDGLAQVPGSLYNGDADFADKTIGDYEKAFGYGTSKEKLDEAIENAVLKSELYGGPASIGQYGYYGSVADERKRRRRNAKRLSYETRLKRDADLSPEELLTILTLWENERQKQPYRSSWQNYESSSVNLDNENDNEYGEEEEKWLSGPVYPRRMSRPKTPQNYYYEREAPQTSGRWGEIAEGRKKRFMVAKKRNDPTRDLGYSSGGPMQSRSDYYTLAQLLSSQRGQDVPLYRRLML